MTHNPLLVANAGLTAEEFEGETVLLDVVRGLYYSLGGAATELWRAFGEPRGTAEVVDALCRQLAGADRVVLQDAVERMRDNQLLVPSLESSGVDLADFTVTTRAFVLPTVEVFSDLADLISIDPVHEVDAVTGWPVRPDSFPHVG